LNLGDLPLVVLEVLAVRLGGQSLSNVAVAEYLSQVLTDGDDSELAHALGHIAKARGMTQIAKDAGIGRESLYKALRADAHPRFDTISRVCRALGVKFVARPI
jgi:probable addiction module antidote protein